MLSLTCKAKMMKSRHFDIFEFQIRTICNALWSSLVLAFGVSQLNTTASDHSLLLLPAIGNQLEDWLGLSLFMLSLSTLVLSKWLDGLSLL